MPFEIGAVVEGLEMAFQTPDSGQLSPVRARVPIGLRVLMNNRLQFQPRHQGLVDLRTKAH